MTYSYKYKRKNDSLWKNYLDKLPIKLSSLDSATSITAVTILTYILIVFVGAYVLLRRTGVLPPNAFRRLIWRIFVYAIPPSLVLALERRKQSTKDSIDPFESENSYAATRTFGAKSQAVKRILGIGSISVRGISSSTVLGTGFKMNQKPRALPGLFNRDNECYQNSIIQGLASLSSFCELLEKLPSQSPMGGHSTLTGALQAIILGLNSPDNHGRGLWTPWTLKSMSSWQQQDAQEYYSRVIDEVEKDIKRTLKAEITQDDSLSLAGLELDDGKSSTLSRHLATVESTSSKEPDLAKLRNPLEGLQAQRVGCLQCGYVEGLSLIPFNCITVSLGRKNHYDMEGLLNSYTDLETIPGVECARCTLLKQEKILQRLIETRSKNKENDAALQAVAQTRLEAVQHALSNQDFSEATLSKQCQISAKARAMTDKTKQSVIARAPQSLVLHVNRSVFDERTGTQLKNYSQVQFPKLLDLDRWSLGSSGLQNADIVENWETDPSVSMVGETEETGHGDEENSTTVSRPSQAIYTLCALITHYGTHGDGHYVAWRQDPTSIQDDTNKRTWWRLSDDDVVEFDEDIVLKQGGVFMLFYQRISAEESTLQPDIPAPTPEELASKIKDPESPSAFLSSEIQAALDAKLDKYTSPKDVPVSIKASHTEKKRSLVGLASAMRTASEARPIVMESVGSVLDVA